ncbi:hypothetical protein PMAYCL1PPCAC_05636 [Pristionchus mayeri]|uniref:Uncharacterized protein n=1 Tax=Pristionchus mayeri TaxID=1317129 RepID=A0AAN4ZAG1_9BILA|nr:hypothetical protein PMAYCL1PPCAC_05636 [Pristionchus mayeri]
MSRCCFGAIRITVAAQICAALLVIGIAVSIVLDLLQKNATTTTTSIVIKAVVFVLELICAIFVFVACGKARAAFMLPMLIYSVVSMLLVVALIILLALGLLALKSGQEIVIASIIVYCVSLALIIWFFIIFKRCHKHLNDVENSRKLSQLRS